MQLQNCIIEISCMEVLYLEQTMNYVNKIIMMNSITKLKTRSKKDWRHVCMINQVKSMRKHTVPLKKLLNYKNNIYTENIDRLFCK